MSTAPRADHLSTSTTKASQRDRVIAAMTQLCARQGYRDATIAEAITIAGVSRATFYEHFAHKHDCLLAAQQKHTQELTQRLQAKQSEGTGRGAPHAMLAALLGYATEHPAATQLLGNESLAAGEDAARAHDDLLQTLGATFTSTDAKATRYLVAPAVLLNGVLRMLQPPLQAGETTVERFLDDIAAWLSRYELAPDAAELQPTVLAHTPAPRFLPEPPLLAPKPLSPGRRVLPQGEINRNRRERILYATAQAVTDCGYLEVTVDDIVARAQIARRAFYQHFEDTDAAFLATLEFFSQPLLAATAGAFFSTRPWPQRILAALEALLNFLGHYPAIAHALLIDSPAAGQAAARSIHATERALMLLLEEGFNESVSEPPPRLAAELTIATVMGLANQRLRTERADRLPRQLPGFAALVLTPFLGAEAAGDFIRTQL